MAKPPRSMALNPARAPDSLPMGVRAPARMTEPDMDVTSDRIVRTEELGDGRSSILREEPPRPPGPVARRRGLGSGPGRQVGCLPMQAFREAIVAGATGEEIAAIALPEAYRAAYVRRDEVDMFAGLDSADKDP